MQHTMNISLDQKITALTEARDYISKPGHWCAGRIAGHGGQVCAFGAIDYHTTEGKSNWLIGQAGMEELGKDVPEPYASMEVGDRKEYDAARKRAVERGDMDFATTSISMSNPITKAVYYNNVTDQERMVALFDKTIARLKAERGVEALKAIAASPEQWEEFPEVTPDRCEVDSVA